jgi:hypothetical protein
MSAHFSNPALALEKGDLVDFAGVCLRVLVRVCARVLVCVYVCESTRVLGFGRPG